MKRRDDYFDLVVKNDHFFYSGGDYTLAELYTQDFYNYVNQQADNYNTNNIFDNAMFFFQLLDFNAINYFISKNKIKSVFIDHSSHRLGGLIADVAEKNNVEIKWIGGKACFPPCKWLRVFATFIYLIVKQISFGRIERNIDYNKDLCVIRTPAAKKKIKSNINREIFYEDKIGTGSFYESFSRLSRLRLLFDALGKTRKQLRYLADAERKWGLKHSKYIADGIVSLRILPVLFYGSVLNALMRRGWKGFYITGNNLDMYACVEERIAFENGMKSICIPHGIEYGYKYPHGFTGDIFYTTSQNASNYLNKLYSTNKFKFDSAIANEMFYVEKECHDGFPKVVYFTEPRDASVNITILNNLLPFCKENHIKLYIKHHPKDNMEIYKMLDSDGVATLEDYNIAIKNNICIARKSTSLLEAIYNNSKSAAILINKKDKATFFTFPSLQEDGINIFESIDELCEWILMELGKAV